MRNLRPPVLRYFLEHCTRLKVLKLVKTLGEESGFAWGQNLQEHVQLRVEAKQAAKKLDASTTQAP